jgi:hypothetical protein
MASERTQSTPRLTGLGNIEASQSEKASRFFGGDSDATIFQ